MKQTIKLLKALTDETRLRILALLEHGELCVCDLIAVLKMPQSTISRHLALLKSSGWVTDRRQGVWMHYRLADDDSLLRTALQQTILTHLSNIATTKIDLDSLTTYMKEKAMDACESDDMTCQQTIKRGSAR